MKSAAMPFHMLQATSSASEPTSASAMHAAKLGLGLAALGRPGYMTLNHARDLAGCYDPIVMESRAHNILDTAYDAGVRYIDVARSYGRGEEFVASWLATRGIEPGAIGVASKWGYTYIGRWSPTSAVHEVKDHSIITFRRQLAETLDRLGAHLGIYQIHSVTAESTVLLDDAVIDSCARLRERGISPGLTVSGPQQATVIQRALDLHRDGRRVFDVVQATWNLYERSATTALADAHAAGMKVVVKEVLANGRLTDRNVEATFKSRLDRVRELAVGLDASVDAVALASALALPWADIVLTGAATGWQLRSNIAALSLEWDSDTNDQLQSISMPSDEYWAARSSFAWN
jgi:aryl-alcohol dehydrogenase-like predicted oxidoreductase